MIYQTSMNSIAGKALSVRLACGSMAVGIAFICSTGVAQDDPFGFGTSTSETVTADSGSSGDGSTPLSVTEDPVVAAIRQTNPRTPAALAKAVRIMLDLGDTEEAQRYLNQLIGMNLDAAAMYRLQQEVGSDLFLRLARETSLGPEGSEFGRLVMDTSYQEARNPARVDALVTQLTSTDPVARSKAYTAIKRLGSEAVAPLVKVLLDADRKAEFATVRNALIGIGVEAVGPLCGVISSPNETAKVYAVFVLGKIGDTQALPFLLKVYLEPESSQLDRQIASDAIEAMTGVAPTAGDALTTLARMTERRFEQASNPFRVGESVTIWKWDASQQAAVPLSTESATADYEWIAQVSDVLYRIAPERTELRDLYFTSLLEANRRQGGFDKSIGDGELHDSVAALGCHVVEELMSFAIDHGAIGAATSAAEILGDIGDASVLESDHGQTRPLAAALIHPNRRLRFAATQAIVQISPPESFNGASHLGQALEFFSGARGLRRVLIGHPRLDEASTLVGQLARMGFAADAVQTAKQLILKAQANPDYEFVLVSDAIGGLKPSLLVQQIRLNTHTADMPIGLLAVQNELETLQSEVEEDPLTMAFAWPYHGPNIGLEYLRRQLLDIIAPYQTQTLLIGHSNLEEAQVLVGQLSGLGLEIEIQTEVQPFIERAIAEENLNLGIPQYAVSYLLIGELNGVSDPGAFVEQLRRERRIAELPIGLMTRAQYLDQMEPVAERHENLLVFLWPNPGAANIAHVFEQLDLAIGHRRTTPEERIRQAVFSLQSMLTLNAEPLAHSYFNPARYQQAIISAFYSDQLMSQATELLAEIGSPTAQRELVNFASQPTESLVDRQAAAKAFHEAVQRRGTMLTTREIALQYERYNLSESQDKGSQEVLASILDTIEQRAEANLQAP